MALFDIFSGAPARRAAQQQRGYFDQIGGELGSNTQQGLGYLQGGYNDALGQLGGAQNSITAGYGTAKGDITAGTDAGSVYLRKYGGQARDYLTSGREGGLAALRAGQAAGQGYLGTAAGAYGDLATKYGAGSTMYSNALGLNGQGGIDAAQGAFKAGPSYTFNLDQGLEAINRRRNAGGMLASGNADRDAQDYGAGLASNEYGGWLNRLQGYQPLEMSATAGRAGVLGRQADLAASGGAQEAGLISGTGQGLAGLASQEGQGLAGLAPGQGQALAGLATGQGRSLADLQARGAGYGMQLGQNQADMLAGLNKNKIALAEPYAKSYGEEAAAQMKGSGNIWDLGMNLAKLGMGVPGGGGSMFGGGAQKPGLFDFTKMSPGGFGGY